MKTKSNLRPLYGSNVLNRIPKIGILEMGPSLRCKTDKICKMGKFKQTLHISFNSIQDGLIMRFMCREDQLNRIVIYISCQGARQSKSNPQKVNIQQIAKFSTCSSALLRLETRVLENGSKAPGIRTFFPINLLGISAYCSSCETSRRFLEPEKYINQTLILQQSHFYSSFALRLREIIMATRTYKAY